MSDVPIFRQKKSNSDTDVLPPVVSAAVAGAPISSSSECERGEAIERPRTDSGSCGFFLLE